jgi:hypothetical protein
MSWKRMLRMAGQVGAVAVMLGMGAGAAHADGPFYPRVGTTYVCTLNVPPGNVFVTYLSLSGDIYHKTGWVRNAYPDGSSNQKPVDLTWDFMVDDGAGTTRFDYVQTQNNIQCVLKTSSYGAHLVYTCGSTVQDCSAS